MVSSKSPSKKLDDELLIDDLDGKEEKKTVLATKVGSGLRGVAGSRLGAPKAGATSTTTTANATKTTI